MTAGGGLDREAAIDRAIAAARECPLSRRHYPYSDSDYRTDIGAVVDAARSDLLGALEAAEARLAESVPRSSLVQVGWKHCGHVCPLNDEIAAMCAATEPVYVLRTEGGAS